MAGVKAGCVHLCRVAGNTVIPYGKWHSIAVPWNASINGYTVPLPLLSLLVHASWCTCHDGLVSCPYVLFTSSGGVFMRVSANVSCWSAAWVNVVWGRNLNFLANICKFPVIKLVLQSIKDFQFEFSYYLSRKIIWNLLLQAVCIKKLHFIMHSDTSRHIMCIYSICESSNVK